MALVSCLRGIVVSELIPFFDECLAVSDILPRIREELEMALASVSQDSPEYAKLRNLQIVLSSEFAAIAREVVDNPAGFPKNGETVRKLNTLLRWVSSLTD